MLDDMFCVSCVIFSAVYEHQPNTTIIAIDIYHRIDILEIIGFNDTAFLMTSLNGSGS